MRATFTFHGELNDLLSPDRRHGAIAYSVPTPGAVKDMIEALGVPHPEVGKIVVNGSRAGFDWLVRDGDRVDVYPCAAEPDAEGALPCSPPGDPRFVLDVHLGTLAGYLRLLGFDSLYRNDYEDEALAQISAREGRILLTRDVGLLKRSIVQYGYFVRARQPAEQLREIVVRYVLAGRARPLTRCLRCNGALHDVAKDLVVNRLPEHVAACQERFSQCDGCGQVYWEGSHMERMQALIRSALDGA